MLEREIKYRLPEGRDASAVCEAIEDAGFRLESSGSITHEDFYLDTLDWTLYRAGIALRLRKDGSRCELQAKTILSESDEILARTEWTQAAPASDPPWESLPEGPVFYLLKPLAPLRVLEGLTIRARVASERKTFRWMNEREILGSVTLDRVFQGAADNGGESYRELEVEALDGAAAAALDEVRTAVERKLDLRTSVETKLAAALAMAGEKLPDLKERERPYALYEGDRLADVAAKTLGRHLTRMYWNEAGTRLNLDPVYLHDMRVATRRLRTALLVFAIAIPEEAREALGRDLRWIGRALGSVRDLDVGLTRVAALAAKAPEHERAVLYVFARYLEIKRARRRTRLLRRLDSKRFTAFRERANQWIAGLPGVVIPIGDAAAGSAGPIQPALAPAYMVGPRIVAEWDNRMREACHEAERKSTLANVHALRIAVKHARYAVEYFAVSEGQAAHHRAKQLARIQDKLGQHQDAATLLRHMRRYARSIPPRDRQLVLGAQSVMDRLEPDVRITRAELHDLWELGAGADVT
jgi:CHAD domain-containing protein